MLAQSPASEGTAVYSPQGALDDIGARLRTAREQRRMTLRDISNETKIPIKVLDTIERNDFARLPHRFFVRAFVRAYAAQVGVDPTQAVEDYLGQFPSEPIPGPIVELQATEVYEDGRRSQVSLLVMLSLAVAYGGYGAFVQTDLSSPPATHFSAAAAAGVPNHAEIMTAGLTAGLGPATDAMQLQIRPQSPCLVSAMADGRPVISRLMLPGEHVVVEGREEVVLRMGDGGACSYSMNGVRSGRPGDVVTIRITGEKHGSSEASMAGGNIARRDRPMAPGLRPVSTLDHASRATAVLDETVKIGDPSVLPSILNPAPSVLEPTHSTDAPPIAPPSE